MKNQDDSSVLQQTHSFNLYSSAPEISRRADSTKPLQNTAHQSDVLNLSPQVQQLSLNYYFVPDKG